MKAMKLYIGSILAGVTLLASCTAVDYPDRFQLTPGVPSVDYVRYADRDLIIDQAAMAETVCIVGENLTSVHDLYFNDQQAILNTSYMTAHTLIVAVPKTLPTVEDNKIKSSTGVKVKITIPKDKHKFVGPGGVLYYQADTLSIRFSDYVLDNFKVMEDPSETLFEYEFWYKADDPLTDLNIMVNFKETGTSDEIDASKTGSGAVSGTPTITIDGKTVTITDGKGTITTSDGTSVITITGKT